MEKSITPTGLEFWRLDKPSQRGGWLALQHGANLFCGRFQKLEQGHAAFVAVADKELDAEVCLNLAGFSSNPTALWRLQP